jgi:hypothetical protein
MIIYRYNIIKTLSKCYQNNEKIFKKLDMTDDLANITYKKVRKIIKNIIINFIRLIIRINKVSE